MTRNDDIARLAELEAAFAHNGGRGVELAEEIDALRARIAPKTFYRRVITLELLSEEPYYSDDFEQIAYDMMDGDLSGYIIKDEHESVDGPTMAKLLISQGSDPEFFHLDEEGNNLDADDEYDEYED